MIPFSIWVIWGRGGGGLQDPPMPYASGKSTDPPLPQIRILFAKFCPFRGLFGAWQRKAWLLKKKKKFKLEKKMWPLIA